MIFADFWSPFFLEKNKSAFHLLEFVFEFFRGSHADKKVKCIPVSKNMFVCTHNIYFHKYDGFWMFR